MASVFVAGKVEECIRRARDIVNVFHHLYCLIRNLPAHPIPYVGDIYYVWRDRLCTQETLLLRELGFHVQPALPVGLLLSYLKILEMDGDVSQSALNYLNDGLKSNAYILFQPRVLATTAISLALDRHHLRLPDHHTNGTTSSSHFITHPWYSLFDVNQLELEECRRTIMSVYYRELDTLLPLTKEELAIFSDSIREIDTVAPPETATKDENDGKDSKLYQNHKTAEERSRDINRQNSSSSSHSKSSYSRRSHSRSRSRSRSHSHSRSRSRRRHC